MCTVHLEFTLESLKLREIPTKLSKYNIFYYACIENYLDFRTRWSWFGCWFTWSWSLCKYQPSPVDFRCHSLSVNSFSFGRASWFCGCQMVQWSFLGWTRLCKCARSSSFGIQLSIHWMITSCCACVGIRNNNKFSQFITYLQVVPTEINFVVKTIYNFIFI